MRNRPPGFTLIELLVVVTIIVVLLALLTPALDRAIDQAEMVNCGARLDAMGSGAILYAYDNSRRYPNRPGNMEDDTTTSWSPNMLSNSKQSNNPLERRDVRPIIKEHINPRTWACPKSPDIDLSEEATINSNSVFAGFNMFFGFVYAADDNKNWPQKNAAGKGMKKIGDKWSFKTTTGIQKFGVLANDIDWVNGNGESFGSHPDNAGTMAEVVYDGTNSGWAPDGTWTWTLWRKGRTTNPIARGLIDVNAARDDGSVARYNGVRAAKDAQTTPQIGVNPEFAEVAWLDTRLNYAGQWINVPLR